MKDNDPATNAMRDGQADCNAIIMNLNRNRRGETGGAERLISNALLKALGRQATPLCVINGINYEAEYQKGWDQAIETYQTVNTRCKRCGIPVFRTTICKECHVHNLRELASLPAH